MNNRFFECILYIALILTAGGCMSEQPYPNSGCCRLSVSKEGNIVNEVIDKNSQNGKWFFCAHIDKDSNFGSLWNVIEERWVVAESEWTVICDDDRCFEFTPGDECDRMYGSLVSFRYVEVEVNEEGRVRICEENCDIKALSSAPVCVLLRFPRTLTVGKMIDIAMIVLKQYKFVADVFVKPIDLPVHGEFPVPWLDPLEETEGRMGHSGSCSNL